MKRKSLFIIGVTGVLALSIGLSTELESTEILAMEQPRSESLVVGQADSNNGDQNRVITIEEQNMVENSSDLSGFVSQENGPGFYFEKEIIKDSNNGGQNRVVTIEEQEMREKSIEDGDQITVITVEEQNMVENSSDLSGFVPQENGPGFYFEKKIINPK